MYLHFKAGPLVVSLRDEIDEAAVGQAMAGGRGFFSLSKQDF
jgi:hypothetical protein